MLDETLPEHDTPQPAPQGSGSGKRRNTTRTAADAPDEPGKEPDRRRPGRPRKPGRVPRPRPPVEIPVGDLRALSSADRIWWKVWQRERTDRLHQIRVWAAENLPEDLKRAYFTWTLPSEIREVDCAYLVGCSVPTLRRLMADACRRINEVFPDHWRYLPRELQHYGNPEEPVDPVIDVDSATETGEEEPPSEEGDPPAVPPL